MLDVLGTVVDVVDGARVVEEGSGPAVVTVVGSNSVVVVKATLLEESAESSDSVVEAKSAEQHPNHQSKATRTALSRDIHTPETPTQLRTLLANRSHGQVCKGHRSLPRTHRKALLFP